MRVRVRACVFARAGRSEKLTAGQKVIESLLDKLGESARRKVHSFRFKKDSLSESRACDEILPPSY